MQTIRNYVWATVGIALLALGLFLASVSPVLPALAAITNFDSVTLANDLVVGDDAVIGSQINFSAAAGAVLTTDATLTPAGTYQPVSAAGAVGTASITAGDAGDYLIIVNTLTNTITFTDTGTLKLSGNAVLGQFDTLTLLSDGVNWLEVAQVDN